MRRRHRASSRAFTLVELVVSTAVAGLVLGGLTAAMLLASRAMPNSRTTLSQLADAAQAIDELAAELHTAGSVTERTAHAVTFSVADRDGDGNAEAIRYAWSGTAGDPLTRKYNAQSAVSVLPEVRSFELEYTYRDVTEEGSPAENESAEMLLLEHQPSLNLLGFDITSSDHPGQFFRPDLPLDAVSWSVSRVQFQAKSLLSIDGVIDAQLRTPQGGNLPSATVVASAEIPESLLGLLYAWHEATYTGVTGLSPDQGLCLVLAPDSGSLLGDPGTVKYQSSGTSLPGSAFVSSTDSGLSWTANDARGMAIRVYGKVVTLGDPPDVTRTYLTQVRIKVAGTTPGRYASVAVPILNSPEVSGS